MANYECCVRLKNPNKQKNKIKNNNNNKKKKKKLAALFDLPK